MTFLGFATLTLGGLLLWAAYYGQPLGVLLSAFVTGGPMPARRAVGA